MSKESAIDRATRTWHLDGQATQQKEAARELIDRRLRGEFKSLDETAINNAARYLNALSVSQLLAFFEPEKLGKLKTDTQYLQFLGAA